MVELAIWIVSAFVVLVGAVLALSLVWWALMGVAWCLMAVGDWFETPETPRP